MSSVQKEAMIKESPRERTGKQADTEGTGTKREGGTKMERGTKKGMWVID